MNTRKLPLKLERVYSFGFLMPFLIILLGMLYFDFFNLSNILILGFVYVIGSLFCISKALYGKREWLYSEIIFILKVIVLLTLYSKIV